MTTLDTPSPHTFRAGRRTAPRGIPLSRIVTTELRKMFDTRSGFWLMASIAILALLATLAVILFAPDNQMTYKSFVSAIGITMKLVLPMIAILSETGEWSQRRGSTTSTLGRHRARVIADKASAGVGGGCGRVCEVGQRGGAVAGWGTGGGMSELQDSAGSYKRGRTCSGGGGT